MSDTPQAWMIVNADGLRHSVQMSQFRAEDDAHWLNTQAYFGSPFRVVPLYEGRDESSAPVGDVR